MSAASKSKRRRERKPLNFNNLPKGLSPDQVAEVLGLSEASYRRHVRPHVLAGEILSVPVGRNVRILTSSLLAWWEAQAQKQQERWRR